MYNLKLVVIVEPWAYPRIYPDTKRIIDILDFHLAKTSASYY